MRLEITKPDPNIEKRLEDGKREYTRMMEDIKPFIKKSKKILDESKVEWSC